MADASFIARLLQGTPDVNQALPDAYADPQKGDAITMIAKSLMSPTTAPEAGVDWSKFNQPMGELTDTNPVAYKTRYGNIYQGDINAATDAAMAVSGGGLGIKAYHGSPHNFDRFDLSKIGTGEGAQAYGHGLYFAENEGVARSYRSINAPPGYGAGSAKLANDALQMAHDTGLTGKEAEKFAREYLTNQAPRVNALPPQHYYDAANNFEALTTGKGAPGHMYEVNINADPAHFLDWDSNIAQQSDFVRSILSKNGGNDRASGREAYNAIASQSAPLATDVLNKSGIPGIKYLDQGSRGAGEGSSNYVVFNDKLIDIMKKYGIAGAPAGLFGLGGALQDDQQ